MKRALPPLCAALALVCVFLALHRTPARVQAATQTPPRATLRVGFWTLWHDHEIQLTPAGTASYRTCASCNPTQLSVPIKVKASALGGLTLIGTKQTNADTLILTGPIRIAAHGESELLSYPLTLTARNGSLVMAVELPLETYVERVVASESGPADTPESLAALAVAVRSYALHERHGHADYDLCDSTHCQFLHWHGVPQRRAAAHAATLHTAGETLWFQNRRALTYFNKDCGGHSASIADVWPRSPSLAYLSAHADTYCARTPSQQWSSDLSRSDLAAALARRGLAAPGWQHLSVDHRSVEGRVVTLRADRILITAEDFRIAVGESLGWNRVQSNWFEVSERTDRFLFHGRGSGHGLGLCQKGAAAMGALGRSSAEILAQYFPGAYVADESTGKRWNQISGEGFILASLDPADTAFLPDLARARAEASQRSGLNARTPLRIRAFATTTAFRNATLAPGWVAAFTEGDWIATQPLRTLAQRKLLASTMRHEFLHALVESEAGPAAPLWLREGLVEFWALDPAQQSAMRRQRPTMPLDALEAALRNAASEAQSQTAHREAALRALQLLDTYGRERVLSWLRTGVPSDALLRLGQR
jgi:stage II sporulation protein D